MRRLLAILAPLCLSVVAAQAAGTSISITASSTTPITFGTAFTLTATVSPSSSTGLVTFFDGQDIIGTSATGAGGIATCPNTGTPACSTSLVPIGAHKFYAAFQATGGTGAATTTATPASLTITGLASSQFIAPTGSATTVTTPKVLVTGDFNNDGVPDLATITSTGTVLSILIGNKDGTFQTPLTYNIPNATPYNGLSIDSNSQVAKGIAIADINQDGFPDLVIGQYFTASASNAPCNLSCGGFSGTFSFNNYPGFQILAFTNLADGSGGFTPPTSSMVQYLPNFNGASFFNYGLVPGMTAGDYLHTGKTSVAYAFTKSSVDIGTGTDTYTGTLETMSATGSVLDTDTTAALYPTGIFEANLENNGNPDVIVTGQLISSGAPTSNQAFAPYRINTSSYGTFNLAPSGVIAIAGTNKTVAIVGVAPADFNGDGFTDIAVGDGNGVDVYYGNSSGGYAAAKNVTAVVGVKVNYMRAIDINADGIPDLVFDNNAGSGYTLLGTGNNSGTLFSLTPYSPFATLSGINGMVVSDFNADGHQDFASVGTGSGTVTVSLGSIPLITSISPTGTVAGATNAVINITGPYFASNDSIIVGTGGSAQTITPTNCAGSGTITTCLAVHVPSSFVTSAGTTVALAVKDTSTGAVSAASTLTVGNAPSLTGVSPTFATVSPSSAVTIVLSGANLPSSPTVNWVFTPSGGAAQAAQPLTVSSSPAPTSTSITATIPTSYLNSLGTAAITVQDPSSGVSSNSEAFNVAPHPGVTSINPTSVGVGSTAFTLTINGVSFQGGDSVIWTPSGGSATTFTGSAVTVSSSSQIQVLIPANLVSAAGTATVQVADPSGVASSSSATFTISGPVIGPISPSGAIATSTTQVNLTVSGSNFIPSSVVNWCFPAGTCTGAMATNVEAPLVTTYVSGTQLTAVIPTSDLSAAGTAAITVSNGTVESAAYQPFTIGNLTLSSILPSSATAGSTGFTMTLSGSNFASNAIATMTIGGTATQLTTSYVSASQLSALVPSNLLTTATTASITVAIGNVVSNAVTLTILPPTISGITPTTTPTGVNAFPLKVTGSNFLNTSIVQWSNGSSTTALSTSFTDANDLVAIVPSTLVTGPGTAVITVMNPGGAVSTGAIFTVGPAPTINTDSSGLNPFTAAVGSGPIQIVVQGTNFQSGSIVSWNNGGTVTSLATGFVNSTELTATVTAALLANPGNVFITVQNPGPVNSNSVTFTVGPTFTPTVTTLTPNSTIAGGPQFQIILTGSNFVNGSTLQWNPGGGTVTSIATSVSIPTGQTTASQLSAIIPASLITTAGGVFISVLNPGGGTSVPLPFTINSNQPTITNLSPASATAGSSSFPLTVTGTNFVNGSTVMWNAGSSAQSVPTSFVNNTTLTAIVPTTFLATSGTVLVTVTNPPTTTGGTGASSGSAVFSITPTGPPVINTTAGVAPSTATVGAAQFLITISGSNFFSGSVVQWTAGATPTALTTSFISSTQLSALVPASLVTAVGTTFIDVQNPGGAISNLVPFTVSAAPGPTISTTSPASSTAGDPSFQLTVTGTNYATGSVVQWNNGSAVTPLATVVLSATQVSALVPASLLTTAGTAFIDVMNTGGAISNLVAYTINGALTPTISTTGGLSPAMATLGASSTQLVITGTNFIPTSVAQWNPGTGPVALSTVYLSSTQLTAIIPTADLATAGTAFVSVSNGTGNVSNSVPFTIVAPGAPTILTTGGLTPSTAVAGSAALQISITGTNFISTSVAQINTGSGAVALTTTFLSATQLSAIIPAANLAAAGNAFISVSNGGAGVSNSVLFTITAQAAPTIDPTTGLTPNTALAGSAATTITVTGTNYLSTSVVQWNSGSGPVALPTVFLSATQLSATIPATDLTTVGTSFVTVSNGTGNVSNAVAFTITAQAAPTISTSSGLSPAMANVGTTSLQMTVTGTNFITTSVVNWNAGTGPVALTTVYINSTTLTAIVPTADFSSAGTAFVTVTNGSVSSNAVPFTIVGLGAPTVTALSPATAIAGAAATAVTITGTNFISTSVAQWNSGSGAQALATTYLSSTQLSAIVPATDLTTAGSAFVSVANGTTSSNSVLFTITAQPSPIINTTGGLSPASAVTASPATQLMVNGSNFISTSVVQWNSGSGNQALATTYVSANLLTAIIPAANLTTAGTAFVTVTNGTGLVSNSVSFAITAPVAPTLTTLTPSTVPSGVGTFQLTITGTNFNSTSAASWNAGTATALSTVFVSSTTLTAVVPGTLLTTAGSAFVSVTNTGTTPSNVLTFTISPANPPTINTTGGLSPASAPVGSAAVQLTVLGTNFNPTAIVDWNSGSGTTALATIYVSPTQLSAVIPSNLLATAGTGFVSVNNGNNSISNTVSFSIVPPSSPTILSSGGVSPSAVTAGSPSVQLMITGTNFLSTSVVNWNAGTTTALATSYISATQLSAVVPASLLTTATSAFISVTNPGPLVSNTVPFTVNAPSAPTITTSGGVAPTSVTSGGAAFQLTITGTNFLSTSVVNWNNGTATALATSYIDPNHLTAIVPASLITTATTVFISVTNPGPLVSNTVPFTVNPPDSPSISTANGLIPSTIAAAGPGFQLIIIGTNFLSTSVVNWNAGTPTALTTSYVSPTQLTAVVPAALIATTGTSFISVTNPGPLVSNTVPFVITASVTLPTINSGGLNPAAVAAGSPAFQLTVSGTNYQNGSIVMWNAGGTATALTTGFGSSTTLTALIPATLVATPGLAFVSITNPDKTVSNSVTFNISGSIPVLTQLTPNSAPAGSQGVNLVITGTGFSTGASVIWGTTPVPTIVNSATQLTATIGPAQLSSSGPVAVSVQASGGTSNSLTFTVGGPVITLLSPGVVTAGAPAFTLSVGGDNFANGAVVSFGGTALTTTFVSANSLTALVPAALVTNASSISVTVTNPGGAVSAGFGFSVGAVPNIQSISPTSAAPGSPAFTLQVTGANFANGDTVQWNGVSLVTTYGSATSLSAAVTAPLLTNSGTVNVSVLHNGGVASNAIQFTISSATLTSISPTTAAAGSPTTQLTISGTNFVNGSGVQWNGTAIPTTFVSATQLSATVNATLLASVGTAFVTVSNPGGSTTTGLTFAIAGPTLTSISPNSATVGASTISLALTGTNFVTGSVATWNGTTLPTSVSSATNATAQVAPTLLSVAGSFVVVMTNPGGSVTTSQFFTVNAPPAPTISSVSPASAVAGSSAFQITVNGTGFLAGSVIQWNGNALTTSVTPTQLNAVVAATLIATSGTANITVQVPGAPISATTGFPINPPVISSLNPTTVSAGGPAFQLQVNGGNFIPGSTVQWAGTTLPTIYTSATQLTADVAASLITSGGTASITVTNGGTAVSTPVTFTIGPFTLVISTTSLPDAIVGSNYSQVLTATGGSPNSTGGYTWSVTAGTLPAGITLDPPSGTLSGIATAAATGTVGFTVTDSVARTVTKSIAFRSVTPLTISTTTPLTSAPAGVPGFSQILTPSGGTAPYIWSLTGTLPPGLVLDTNKGVISGTPTVPGSFNFQINVADSRSQTYSAPYSQTITVNGVTIGGLPSTATSVQQLPVNLTIASPYTVDLNGTLTMVFTSAVGGTDPAIQFSTGGLKANFTIPAGATQAVFAQNLLAITGTTAGSMVVSAAFTAGGANVTPATVPSVTVTIAKAAPVITGLTLTTSGTNLVVTVTGYSNTRDMTSGTFQFIAAAGSTLTAAPITVNLAAQFTTYYQSQASANSGSQFTFSVPISFTGNLAAVGSVSATLINSAGTSAAVTATRQ